MRATLNQTTNEKIYRGEDKTIVLYLYDEETFEPINLSAYDEYLLCLPNDDLTTLSLTGALTGTAVEGKITFTVTAVESALLAVQTNNLVIRLNNTVGPVVDIEEFPANQINVVDASC
jgi:hypothetical protein